MSYQISVIIPVYLVNKELKQMTYECLEGLYTFRHAIHEVIVVDDGSPIKIEGTWFKVIERLENGGFASAVNAGLREARGNVMVICNNDVEFIDPEWLIHLTGPLDTYGICSIRTTDSDGYTTDKRLEENAKFGSLWAITRDALETIGYLDERFGHGTFEDLDYWRRAQDAKVGIVKNHAGLVEHRGKATFKVVDPKDSLYGVNMFKYKEKWGDKAYIFETAPDTVILLDDYEIKDDERRRIAIKHGISLEEARSRWSNA